MGNWTKHWIDMRDNIALLASCIIGTTTKRINVVLCGTQTGGTVTPLKCDANGQLVTVVGS